MSFNWKRGLLVGVIVFLYLLAVQNFWPDLDPFLNSLIVGILAGVTAKFSESIFNEKSK